MVTRPAQVTRDRYAAEPSACTRSQQAACHAQGSNERSHCSRPGTNHCIERRSAVDAGPGMSWDGCSIGGCVVRPSPLARHVRFASCALRSRAPVQPVRRSRAAASPSLRNCGDTPWSDGRCDGPRRCDRAARPWLRSRRPCGNRAHPSTRHRHGLRTACVIAPCAVVQESLATVVARGGRMHSPADRAGQAIATRRCSARTRPGCGRHLPSMRTMARESARREAQPAPG